METIKFETPEKNIICKLSDLKVNNVYILTWGKTLYEKVKLLAIINQLEGYTEIYIETKRGTNIPYSIEIGIGETKEQARNNYGKIKYESNENFYKSFTEAKNDIIRNNTKPFFFHNIKK